MSRQEQGAEVTGQVPVVGVVMGSDSDWPVMQAAAAALDEFGIACEVDVVSAHRMPQEMVGYGASAQERGLRVIIAGAGGAAHLPGMLASVTSLPVIGVPVPLKYLDGMDSLLSIVQMPAGVPVATVSVGGARNAGLLAARILGAGEGPEAAHFVTRRTRRVRRCANGAPTASATDDASALHALAAHLGPLVPGARVHHDVEASGPCALGGSRVDHADLHPHGIDPQAVLVRDRLVDDRPDAF